MKDIKLTKKQKKYLPALQWLYSEGNRQEGRSTLIAIALIDAVMKDKRARRISDHLGSFRTDRYLAQAISEMIYDLPLKIKWSTLELRYNP